MRRWLWCLNLTLVWVGTFFHSRGLAINPTINIRDSIDDVTQNVLVIYSDDDQLSLKDRLEKTFFRNCQNFSYGPESVEPMVGHSFMNFPPELLVEYFSSHQNICPYSAREAIMIIEKKLGKKAALKISVTYLTKFKDFNHYAWSDVVWDFLPLLDQLDSSCSRAQLAAFSNLYCGYSKSEDLRHLLKQYYRRCKNRAVNCAPSERK